MNIVVGANDANVQLSGGLDISRVAAAKAPLLDAIDQHPHLEFDLSRVTTLDAAGLQLLILCKHEARRRGHHLQLVRHSPAVLEQFELFNLAGLFGDPLVLPAATKAEGARR